MKRNGIRWTLALLGTALLAAPAGFAQQQQPANSDPYQGVSHPPLDDQIVATPDSPPPPVHVVKAKPSAATPMPPPPPPATTAEATPRYSSASPAPVVTTASSDDTINWNNTDYGIVTTAPAAEKPKWNNTDYGVVVTPVPAGEDNPQIPADPAVLHVRANPVRQATNAGPSNELPAGAQIRVQIDEALSTDNTQVGAPFHGKVMVNVMENGSVIIPAGSMLRGRVTQVSDGHHFGPASSLRLRPDVVVLPDGTAYHLYAQVAYSNADGTQVGSEGALRPTSHVVKKSVEYGASMGTGAVVGAMIAGPPGALAGTIVGAGLVTTHLLFKHPDDTSIPAGSEVTFSLTEPLYLIPTRN